MSEYEIDCSTLMLMSEGENKTRVFTYDDEFVVDICVRKIVDNSCRFFGSNLTERTNMTKRLINITSKLPIVVEETKNIIFFPLKSTREVENIWISFNNIDRYIKNDKKTTLYFKKGKSINLNFSYYIVDNQITRSLMLDYELKKRRKSFEK